MTRLALIAATVTAVVVAPLGEEGCRFLSEQL
jgi:hypothetical protein